MSRNFYSDDEIESFEVRTDGNTLVVSGEIDAAVATDLEIELGAFAVTAKELPVEVDMSGVSFIGSAGVAALSNIHQVVDGLMVLRNPSPEVVRVLSLTDKTPVFKTVHVDL